jgi:hypothetical protein
MAESLHLAARPARLKTLLAAQEYALDRAATCV